MLLAIIIYLLTDNLHNKDVALFIRFSKVIVYENFIYIYIYIYICIYLYIYLYILVISFVTFLTIIMYLVIDDLHNKDDK